MRNDLKRLDGWEAPDQWGQIEHRVPGSLPPEHTPRGSRLVAGLVATSVAVVGLGFGFLQLGGLGQEQEPNPGGPVEVQHLVTSERTIDTGLRFPKGAVVGYGSVWIATRYANQEGGDLLRLDPETGEEQARIPMPALPGWLFGGAGITTGLGDVWIAAGDTETHKGSALYRIEPSTDALLQKIAVGPGDPADLWVDEAGIWVLTHPDGDTMTLYRLDPVSLAVTDTTEVPVSWSQNVFASGGWIYVLGNTEGDAPPETLFRIDPNTAEVVERFQPAGGDPFFVSVSADRVWFFDDGLRALDGATGQRVVGPLREYSHDWCCNLVADDRGGVWVMSSSRRGGGAELWHLDRDGQVTASSGPVLSDEVEGIASAYDEGSMSIWIVQYEDTVLRLGLDVQATHEAAS